MTITKEKLWQAVLGELELRLSRPNFTTWFKNTFVSSISDDDKEVIVGVPNGFTQSWLEKKYHKMILEALQNVSDSKIKKVKYVIEVAKPVSKASRVPKQTVTIPASVLMPKQHTNGFGLNPRYTFSNFIVGKGNEVAYSACQSVTENPGIKLNPLFIYGGVGLGKTHLLQAIGHELLYNRKKDKKRILYTNAEKFTNEFVKALASKSMEKFKTAHREPDVLLIDDIQFFAGKEAVQEEFFHTFNALHQNDRQLVISSDRPPQAILALQERLISRFTQGMIADISSPDLETRMAILDFKAKERKIKLSEEIINYIAAHIQSNVRELEGALNRIIVHHELANTLPDLESVKRILTSLNSRSRKRLITFRDLIKTIAGFYEVDVKEMTGKSRKKELVVPRQVAMYLMREELEHSFPLIGKELGGRDHTTAIYAYNKIKNELEAEGRIKQEIDYIRQRLYVS